MAGQRPTTTEQREQQNHTYQYTFTAASMGNVQYLPLFTAEVPTVIDFASIRANTLNGAARTVKLIYALNGTAPGSGTNITTTKDTNSGADLVVNVTESTEPEAANSPAHEAIIGTPTTRYWGFMDDAASPAVIPFGSGKLPGSNLVPKGATVFMAFNNTTGGTLDGVVLNIRVTEKVF